MMESQSLQKLPEAVYTPDSELRRPLLLLRRMFQDLMAGRELAWRLFVRDMSARYRQTLLGYAWAFLPPIVTTATFVTLNSQGVFQAGETTLPYAAYVMIGTLLWQVFVDAIQAPMRMVTQSKVMLAKINFPREALILAAIAEVIFNFLIRLILLLGVFVWFRLTPPATVFLFPLGLLAIIALGTMIGVLLTPAAVLYQDVTNGITLVTGFWMLLTPVVYPPLTSGPLAFLAKWNPISPLIIVSRDWLTTGASPHLQAFVTVTTATLCLLFASWLLFRLAMPHLVARVGN